MRHVIIDEEFREQDAHPLTIYEDFVNACRVSARTIVEQATRLTFVNLCPACGHEKFDSRFHKDGFNYVACANCASLFLNPRPSGTQLSWYTRESPVARLRAEGRYNSAMTAWIRRITVSRMDWIAQLLAKGSGTGIIIDIEPRSTDFARFLAKTGHYAPIICDPVHLIDSALDALTDKITVVDNLESDACRNARLVTAFQVIEHVVNPGAFIKRVFDALAPGGIFALTTRSGAGFDIQVLGEWAKIIPIEHINLISPEGISRLLETIGFTVVEVSAPGQLDVEMIENAVKRAGDDILPPFLSYFVKHRDRHAKQKLQMFLQEQCLSSHMRVCAVKPETRSR